MRRSALVLALALATPGVAHSQPVPFGSEFRVNSHTTGGQHYGVPVLNDDGTFIVVWGSDGNDGRSGGIFGQRYDAAGIPVGPEFKVNTHTGFASRPDVVSDAQGGFTVVWGGRGQEGEPDVFARRYDAAGAPYEATDFRVNTYTTGTQEEPSIGVDADGRMVVVWESWVDPFDDDQSAVHAQRFNSDGTPDGGEFQVSTTTGGSHHHATVASDANGQLMVAWEVWDANIDVSARRFDGQGNPLTPSFVVNTYTPTTQADGFVASGAAGGFVVVWAAQLSGFPSLQVAGRRYDASGAPIGLEFHLNTVTTSYYGQYPFATVAAGADGSFTAVWRWDEDGSGNDVVGRHYDATGSPVGGEFPVSTATTRDHEFPFVEAGSNGDFLVTWTSWPTNPANGDADIFAQRFRRDEIFADGFESGRLGLVGRRGRRR